MKREFNPKGVNTPWGAADWAINYAEGIDCFSTPGHGGFRLSAVRRLQMPAGLRGFVGYGGPGWYEEDCDWAVVALAFPEVFEAHDVWAAVRTARGFSDGYGASLRAWLDSPGAASVLAIAARFELENGHKFTSGNEGTAGNGWFIEARTINGSRICNFWFPEVPRLPSPYTYREAIAAGGQDRTPKREPLPVQFNESECGGVFDGNTVTSDADPGL